MGQVSDEETKNRIAANLRRYRGNVSLSEVARRAGSYPTTVKEIEDGVRMPGVGLLTRIGEALGVRLEDFLKNPRQNKNAG